jgi:hypothetical protein
MHTFSGLDLQQPNVLTYFTGVNFVAEQSLKVRSFPINAMA